jgi:hypothetical protein
MRNLVVLLGVAAAVLLALRLARRQHETRVLSSPFPSRRAALLGGTLREGVRRVPLAVMEVRKSDFDSMIVAVYEDGAVAGLQTAPTNDVMVFTPRDDDSHLHGAFLDAMRAQSGEFRYSGDFDEPPVGSVIAYLRRGEELLASAPMSREELRDGRHPLSEAARQAHALSTRLTWNGMR